MGHVHTLAAVFSDLIRFETELWDAMDRRLRDELDLPLSWFEPMQIIERRGSCRVNDIAAALSITVGGTSKLVDRIERADHCLRAPNPDDRRSSLIKLTPEGRALLHAGCVVFDDELARRFSAVPEATLRRFHRVVQRLRSSGYELDCADELEHSHG